MPWDSRKLPWSEVEKRAVEYFDGVSLLATLNGDPYRVEPVTQGFGIHLFLGRRKVAAIHRCMPHEGDTEPPWWSVTVEGVQWRLAPNDHRRAIARRGMHSCTYVPDEVQAVNLMFRTFARRNRIRRPMLTLPMQPGRGERAGSGVLA